MAETNKPGINWAQIFAGLPASLAFILAVDWKLGSQIVELYIEQLKNNDQYKLYTLTAFGVVVIVNMVIIASFARVRYLQEKSKIPDTTNTSIKEQKTTKKSKKDTTQAQANNPSVPDNI